MQTLPPWMIDELDRRRREQLEEQGRQLWIEIPEPVIPARERSRPEPSREPIVIEF